VKKSTFHGWLPKAVALAGIAGAFGNQAQAAASPGQADRARLWQTVASWPAFDGGMWMQEAPPGFAQQVLGSDAKTTATAPAVMPLPPGIVLTDAAKASYLKWKKAREAAVARAPGLKDDGNSDLCVPTGPLQLMGGPTAIFYSAGSIFLMIDEPDSLRRRIDLTAATHSVDAIPSWSGDSIGHWEGNTLVIDTSQIEPRINIADGVPSDGNEHLVERLRLLGPDRLEWTATVTDPGVLAKPYTTTHTYKRHTDWQIQPSSCAEGDDRNKPNSNGQVGLDLAPPQ
jgi:hypothetical protein